MDQKLINPFMQAVVPVRSAWVTARACLKTKQNKQKQESIYCQSLISFQTRKILLLVLMAKSELE